MHLALTPGEDWAFLLGMLKVIFDSGLEDAAACAAEDGVEELRRLAKDAALDQLAARAGTNPEAIEAAGLRFGQRAHARLPRHALGFRRPAGEPLRSG